MRPTILTICAALLIAIGYKNISVKKLNEAPSVRLITLDPGHFHASLVQKIMYPDVDPVVYVYAPAGPDLQQHLNRINQYNSRSEMPTHWKEVVFAGDDYVQRMINEKKGNVVVMAGNNKKKTDYIFESVAAGFNVLADKPMAIDKKNFDLLKAAFETARKNKVLLYDIMTERYEITTMLQRELSLHPDIFGKLKKGTLAEPAVTKESVHHFYKYVSGTILTRPAWFLDVNQQGEGIVDVTTHLVDLIQWECFPEQIIDYKKDIQLNSARRWATKISASKFETLTGQKGFPSYFPKDVLRDSMLEVYSNGEIQYTINGVHAKVSVKWEYMAPEGGGDTHYSVMRGTKANLVIRQGKEQQFVPALYIEPVDPNDPSFQNVLNKNIELLQKSYPGIGLKKTRMGWEVSIPEKFRESHEAHFGRVTQKFLEYMKAGKLPSWEVPNMIAKYYVTTSALEMAKRAQTQL